MYILSNTIPFKTLLNLIPIPILCEESKVSIYKKEIVIFAHILDFEQIKLSLLNLCSTETRGVFFQKI